MSKKTKKDKKKKQKDKNPKIPDLYTLNSIDFLTEDFRTSLDLLRSNNEQIKLRAIGRLQGCIAEDPEFVDIIISKKLQSKFVECLKSENVYILRFGIAVIKAILEKPNSLNGFEEEEIIILSKLISKIFIECNDGLVKKITPDALLLLMKSSFKAKLVLNTPEMFTKVFELIKSAETLELQSKQLQILDSLLECEVAKDFLLKTPGFSIEVILCFLKTENHPLKYRALNIIDSISNWENSDYLKLLFDKKTTEIVTNLLIDEQNPNEKEKCYQIMMNCLKLENSDVEYTKSLEFLKLLEWIRAADKEDKSLGINIIGLFSRNNALHQLLFDFEIVDVLQTFLKICFEGFIPKLCETIDNLQKHKYMCYAMCKFEFLKGLINILASKCILIVPYGELILKTLRKFFKYNPSAIHIIAEEPDLIYKLLEKLYTSTTMMTRDGLQNLLEIVQIIVRSKYVKYCLEIQFYSTITKIFVETEDSLIKEKLLRIVKDMIIFREFREYFMENNGIKTLSEHLGCGNYAVMYGHLLLVKYLIKFPKAMYMLTDKGLIKKLYEINDKIKSKTCLCEEILETIFDLCLTLKFFYKSSLSVTDKIRDQFYLMPNEMMGNHKKKVDDVNFLTTDSPVYVVLYGSILRFHAFKLKLPKKQKNPSNTRISIEEDEEEEEDLGHKKSTKYRLNFINSALAIKFHKSLDEDDLTQKKRKNEYFLNKHKKRCEDERLAYYMQEVYEEIIIRNPQSRKSDKIAYLAKYVSKKMNDFAPNSNTNSRHHVMNMHLVHLKEVLKSNLIPIGWLRKGLTRERALLFKVLCDQVDVKVGLSKHKSGAFWNPITLIKSNPKKGTEAVISLECLVDLMDNVGEMLPSDSPAAEAYFARYSRA